jgi:hypothetical protein
MVIYSCLPSLTKMARMKLTARKHVHARLHQNDVPTESHSDSQNDGYFSRILRTMLLALGSSEPLLFIKTPRLLRGNSYLWCVRVVIFEAPALRWKFEVGMREAAQESLSILWHQVSEQMAHSQFHQFPSRVEGAEAMLLPTGDHECMGCFTD